MASFSGIGTVIKNLIGPLSSQFHTSLLNANLPIYSFQEQWLFPKLIPPCDIFWSPHYNIPLRSIRAKKRIVTIHDACHLALQKSLGIAERLYAHVLFRQAVSRSDAIVTDSVFSQTELCKYLSVSPDRLRVIYPGVDFDRFSAPQTSFPIRKKYALPASFFLFVGNVKPHKNLRLILDAYRQSPIEIPLVMIGKIKGLLNPDPLIATLHQNRHVISVGEVNDEEIPQFYKLATALIFPSLYEGFGLPPLEAMAAGCPTIVSNRASLPEVCGDASYYIDPEHPDELAFAMRNVAGHQALREKLIEKGSVQARRFSWANTIQNYIHLFQEVHENR
jgi:glycosyltransferase involved in cell wall biosynthesis